MIARLLVILFFFVGISLITILSLKGSAPQAQNNPEAKSETTDNVNSLSIEYLRTRSYSGSKITTEQELDPGVNYKRYIVSYISDGLKIYGLLTIPNQDPPSGGFPAIVFDHGYIPPEQYKTTERYVAYADSLARAGFVVFKIDYRGNGDSEGRPEGAYFSAGYTIDTINAAESLKTVPYVDPSKIGVWGHSMAGTIVSRALVVRPNEFTAAVIWGGAVGSYANLTEVWWSKRLPRQFTPSARELSSNRPSRNTFIKEYGQPSETSEFWKSISPVAYIADIKTPIQLDHGEADEEVPDELSKIFYQDLKDAGKTAELYTYPGADHNISSPSFELAMQRTIEFFDKYLKD